MRIYKTFQTERLFLRPTDTSDAEFVYRLFNSPVWLANIGDRKVYSIKEAEDYIQNKMIAQLERLGYANYTLILKNTDQKIGVCGLYDRPTLEGVDLGYALLEEFFGQGYATEAAERILNAGFNVFGLEVVQAITLPSNISSQRVLEKIGMRFHKLFFMEGDPEELMLYRLERNAYLSLDTNNTNI
ncbi:MAG: GNAT family N-acetyltransferase [Flavobacteriales bacterium]|nr:GNAT family N-acetyltransferase [Flavobacteriales bacterium]